VTWLTVRIASLSGEPPRIPRCIQFRLTFPACTRFSIPALGHHGGRLGQKRQLVVRVVCPRVRNVVQGLLPRQPVPAGKEKGRWHPSAAEFHDFPPGSVTLRVTACTNKKLCERTVPQQPIGALAGMCPLCQCIGISLRPHPCQSAAVCRRHESIQNTFLTIEIRFVHGKHGRPIALTIQLTVTACQLP
jgi:hypothetical protein